MTVHDYLMETYQGFSQGQPFRPIQIDLNTHTVQVGTQVLVRHGCLMPKRHPLLEGLIHFDGDPYAEIERLYAQYKRSVPTRREPLSHGAFRALSSDQLTMQELENNMSRPEARLRLESFICLGACAGIIPWREPRHFFWQGHDPDCIVYREWIVLKEEPHEVPQTESHA